MAFQYETVNSADMSTHYHARSLLFFYRFLLFHFLKHVLAHTAYRAAPVIRQCFKGSARRNATVRIALLRIIDISARPTLIFCRLIGRLSLSFFRCFRLSDQTFHQCRYLCQILILRIPLGTDIFFNHFKSGTGQLLLQDLHGFPRPAVAAKRCRFLVLELELLQELHPTGYFRQRWHGI